MSIVRRFLEDERGAPELSTILLVAFIVVPLLGLLIVFRNQLGDKAKEMFEKVMGEGEKVTFRN